MNQAREASDSEQPERDGRQASGAGGLQPVPQLVQNAANLLDNNPFSVGTQLAGGTPNPLLPSPATVQLAQLQAQLTLQRLKLAQTAVTSNTAAATVLNQVLSKVAMSRPLFNPLQNATMLSTPHGHTGGPQLGPVVPSTGFPIGGMPFPSQNPAAAPRVGAGVGHIGNIPNQMPGSVPVHPFGNVIPQAPGQQAVTMGLNTTGPSPANTGLYEYNKSNAASTQVFLANEQQCSQHGFMPTVSHSGPISCTAPEGYFGYPKPDGQHGFPKNCYVPNTTGKHATGVQPPAFPGDQHMKVQPHGNQKRDPNSVSLRIGTANHWEHTLNFSSQNKPDVLANSSMWSSTNQPYEAGNDLYNPEEPTSDTKFTPGGPPAFNSLNKQGIANSRMMSNKEQAQNVPDLSVKPLQPLELNDFNGIQPAHLPHVCTICNKTIFNLSDWDVHVKGKMHIHNCMVFFEKNGGRCVTGSPEGTLCLPTNNSLAFNTSSSEDFSSDIGPSYKSSAPTRAFPHSDPAFSSPVPGAQFPQRKPVPGRVVHICNLPEGNCTENDVINLGIPFGKITNYIFMKSTNQAFLEMVYTEAAQAMVQFYQEKPAMINNEKVLIRMSKRYKELQLKKPGKNVEEIIHNIHFQKEKDMFRDVDRYRNERTRSRSPVNRSLSPRSHMASFTSCSPSHSPLGMTRADWGNGKESWDHSPYCRPEEEKDPPSWRDNGEEVRERTDLWTHDRKHYLRQHDKHNHNDRLEGSRGSREKYLRGGSPGALHSSTGYRSRDDEHYRKEYKSRLDKYQKQKHDSPIKSKRKEEGRVRESRRSHPEDVALEDSSEPKTGKTSETSRQKHVKMKDKKAEPDEEEKEKEKEQNDKERKSTERMTELGQCEQTEENCPSPAAEPSKKSGDSESQSLRKNREQEWESGSEVEGEVWYPSNMEELVTVDEVGEEDFIIEPDITELEEIVPVEPQDSRIGLETRLQVAGVLQIEDKCSQLSVDSAKSTQEECKEMSPRPVMENVTSSCSCSDTVTDEINLIVEAEEKANEVQDGLRCSVSNNHSNDGKIGESSDVHLKQEDLCPSVVDPPENIIQPPGKFLDDCKQTVSEEDCSSETMDTQIESTTKEESHEIKDCQETLPQANSRHLEVKSPECSEPQSKETYCLPSWEQEDVFSELSIPLGVEFVVPRTGFFCKLCGLFYTSEETAKTTHCRSTVHYKNLQKYLSQLAEESLKRNERTNSLAMEDAGIVPQFEKK
ncbi:RNA-binding protein 20 [Microcaecilia unicolor]|uniref:RNA-binding protein 20 n=1 Tax=Microcaecilia unicolor TaxID=1415580 RepID=A0A6P7Y0I2_9AMPH|nr:RNA-binding protein 20 [Microcaecilia unicolor]